MTTMKSLGSAQSLNCPSLFAHRKEFIQKVFKLHVYINSVASLPKTEKLPFARVSLTIACYLSMMWNTQNKRSSGRTNLGKVGQIRRRGESGLNQSYFFIIITIYLLREF